MGANRRLNGTSKSEQTNTHTQGRTDRLIESIGPEGRCFENDLSSMFEACLRICQILINQKNTYWKSPYNPLLKIVLKKSVEEYFSI